MKKILLGTTALVLLSGAAAAQQVTTTSPFTVTLGGSIRYDFGVFDEDASNVNRESRIDTRITLKAEAKADNGLVYGFSSRFRTVSDGGGTVRGNGGANAGGNGVTMDRKFLYAKGSWGTVNLGDENDVRTLQEVLAPRVGIGQSDLAAFVGIGRYASAYWPREGGFDTKITYISPTFSGFQAGISYTPETDSGRGITKRATDTNADGLADANTIADIVDLGASYTNTFGGFGVKLAGGVGIPLTERSNAANDQVEWNVGAQVSYAGFTLGGSYFDANQNGFLESSGIDGIKGWNAGLTYAVGPWGVGFNYSATYFDAGATDFTDAVWGVGGAYQVAPGLSLQADVNYVDIESDTNSTTAGVQDNKGWQLVVRTRLDF